MGRPTKLTDEVRESILRDTRVGGSQAVAAANAGISVLTLEDWLRRGRGEHADRKATPLYVGFARDYAQARAQAALSLMAQIRVAVPKDWRAAAFLLERIEASAMRVEVSIDGGGVSVVDREALRRLASSPEGIAAAQLAAEAALAGDAGGNGAGPLAGQER